MKRFRKISIGTSMIGLVLSVGILGQAFSSTHAANTLISTSSQVITPATTDGLPPNGTGVGYSGASYDGNVVLFSSNATNLQGAGTTAFGLYIYNIKTNSTERVDVSTSGVAANDSIFNGANGTPVRISETGRYITFVSKATNLIDGTTGPSNYYSIFIRDTQADTTSLVMSRWISGSHQNYDRNLAVSNDGRFILLASRYIASSYPYEYRIALGDKASGVYSWSALSQGTEIEGSYTNSNTRGSMSCDGAFVTYTDDGYQVRLMDARRGSDTVIDQVNSYSSSPIISCSGRYVLYATTNRALITPTPSGMDAYQHLVRFDRITGQRIYVDSNSSGVFSAGFGYNTLSSEPQENVFGASISDSGDVVLKYGGTGGSMYLKHLSDGSGTLESIGMNTSGAYVNITSFSEITKDGRYIFFSTNPTNLGLSSSASGNQIIRVKTNI